MEFNLENAIAILERTPKTLQAMLRDLPADWTTPNEGGESWSPYDVVGHLIHGEHTDWITRSRIILGDGPDKTFKAFDRFAQFENSKGKTLNQLLDEFEALRAQNMVKLKDLNITSDQFSREGTHPALGTVTLNNLLATWVAHDLGHIAQIARVMAKQYKSEVGPWEAYIPVLNK